MLIIENKIIDEAVLTEKFVCDLSKCKGACCIEGESGAPLEIEELSELENIFEEIKPFLTKEGIQAIEKQGHFVLDKVDRRYKTPLIKKGPCAYIQYENGIAQCGIENAWKAGATAFRKPISCHLYPIRIQREASFESLEYETWEICSPACSLGEALKVPVYQFLKEPIIRKYGESFYAALEYAYSQKKK